MKLPKRFKQITGRYSREYENIKKNKPHKYNTNNRRILHRFQLIVRKRVISRHDIEQKH
jgi:hypothetical protein